VAGASTPWFNESDVACAEVDHVPIANPAFWVKLSLIALAGLNALAFHRFTFRSVATWDRHVPAPAAARVSALASLALWVGVVSCGRLLAYL
jgi:hypothetical protein